jgi:hypothetical protein
MHDSTRDMNACRIHACGIVAACLRSCAPGVSMPDRPLPHCDMQSTCAESVSCTDDPSGTPCAAALCARSAQRSVKRGGQ